MASQLILDKYGSSIAVKNGRFWIRAGELEHFVATNQIKQIHLHKATKITFEVVEIALENQIEILFIDPKGFPFGRIWSNKFGSISTIRKNQVDFVSTPKAIQFIKKILIKKAENQMTVTKMIHELTKSNEKETNETIQKITMYKNKILYFPETSAFESYASFRGYEGNISKIYFSYISNLLPQKYKFGKRTQHPANDMFNCLLNYAYGMLYALVESALIKAGIDPYIGVMHRDEYNRPVLTYDIIEQYRHWADYVVIHLCLQEVIYDDFFEVNNNQYWLNHHGKRILIQCFNDYMAEIISINGLSRSRNTHIELEAQQLATILKK